MPQTVVEPVVICLACATISPSVPGLPIHQALSNLHTAAYCYGADVNKTNHRQVLGPRAALHEPKPRQLQFLTPLFVPSPYECREGKSPFPLND
jgi:hypothetical protein